MGVKGGTAICPWCRKERPLSLSAERYPSNPARLDGDGFLFPTKGWLRGLKPHIQAQLCIRTHDKDHPVIGFRTWEYVDWRFYSASTGTDWEYEVEAECYKRDHPAPSVGCVCGIYGFWWPFHQFSKSYQWSPVPGSAPGAFHNEPLERMKLWGAVAAWGRIHHCRLGFRAEYARIIALALPPADRRWVTVEADEVLKYGCDPEALGRPFTAAYDGYPFISKIARDCGFVALPWPELKTYAAQFGQLASDPIRRGGRRRDWHPGMKEVW